MLKHPAVVTKGYNKVVSDMKIEVHGRPVVNWGVQSHELTMPWWSENTQSANWWANHITNNVFIDSWNSVWKCHYIGQVIMFHEQISTGRRQVIWDCGTNYMSHLRLAHGDSGQSASDCIGALVDVGRGHFRYAMNIFFGKTRLPSWWLTVRDLKCCRHSSSKSSFGGIT